MRSPCLSESFATVRDGTGLHYTLLTALWEIRLTLKDFEILILLIEVIQ